MGDVAIQPVSRPFDATVTPPGSKSLSNRALILSALSDGVCDLSNVLFADDTEVMLEGLSRLGFHLAMDHDARSVRVHGRGGHIDRSAVELFCGNSGTTIRFLTALCALGHGRFDLDGVARMRQRPIAPLVDLLKNLGVGIEYLGESGFAPLRVNANGLPGGIVRSPAIAQSSQFLSAVLMAAPYARNEVQIDLEPNQASWPYVAMTMRLMDEFGVTPELSRDPKTGEPKRIVVPKHHFAATNYRVEPDASNASYFLAAAAINPGSRVTIDGLGKASLQGDIGFADVLHRMGADLIFGKDFVTIRGTETLEGIDINLSNMPDMAQTLAVVALFARGDTVIRGLHTLRVKETDRVAALSNELKKLGATVEIENDDTLIIQPPENPRSFFASLPPAAIETYDDHRMAMSFAVAGTRAGRITIRDAHCVGKTYPNFFEDLDKVKSEIRNPKSETNSKSE
ncbi:3-phosphoshikimate 1-carboxyvinyltransferase [soil metagenome]